MDDTIKINEDFVSGRDGTYYLFDVVSPDKKEFVFQFPNKFNKQKKIVKEVKEYKNDDWYCLSLILSNESDSTIPLCMKDNVTYSYGYVKSLIDQWRVSLCKTNNPIQENYKYTIDKKALFHFRYVT